MKKILPLILLVPCIAFGANSHQKASMATRAKTGTSLNAPNAAAIKGVVKDETGAPLAGVSVLIKGTTTGTQTDVNGAFTLNTKPGDVLIISYVGYASKQITVGGETYLNITIASDTKNLNEVVVTALGVTRSQSSLTYNTQKVSGSELTDVKTDNLMNALNGKVAGLTIAPSASGVGGSAKVILRGSRSVAGNNQPLYVIDGVPISNGGNANQQQNSVFGGAPDGGDGISNLNPEDIESMTVLEGASAAALYGSQAQNGVILITTKKGKAGKTVINFSSGYSVDHIAYKPAFQNQYGTGSNGVASTISGSQLSWGAPITGSQDNLSDFFQNGTNFTNAINLSGGSDAAQTYFSYANTYARGIQPGNDLRRNNFNLNETAHFLNNKLTVSANVNYIDQTIDNSPSIGLYLNPLTGLYLFPRGVSISPYKQNYETVNSNGTATQNWPGDADIYQNPWFLINDNVSKASRHRILINGSVKYDFNDWLNLQVRGNVDRTDDNYENDRYSGINTNFNGNGNGYLGLNSQVTEQKYADAILNFKIPIKHSDFKIQGLLGTSITDVQASYLSYNANNSGDLTVPNIFTPSNVIAKGGGSNVTATNVTPGVAYPFSVLPYRTQLQALFGSADFSYKNWLYLDITGRNDWSSALSFTPNDSYFYPSAGLSAVLSNMLALPTDISYAKIRASYAQVGNTVLPGLTNLQNSLNGSGALVFNTSLTPFTLKPEKTKSLEFGADLRFFDDRLTFNYTFYKTNTYNQVYPVSPSSTTLISTGYFNAGNVQNSGMEFSLGYDVLKVSDFKWNTTVNAAFNKNKIIDVDKKDDLNQFDLTGSGNNDFVSRLVPGGSYGDIYGNTFLRDSQGRIILGGDGTTANPYVPQKNTTFGYLGNANPKFQLGWNNTFSYKNITFSFLVDGKFGGKVMSITQGLMDQAGVTPVTAEARENGGVTINGVNSKGVAVTKVDAQTWYSTIGDRSGGIGEAYMYSATVVRLREADLGYTFPIASKTIKSLKVALTGRNLIYFYKKAPFDPEIAESTGNGLSGVDIFSQPATRNFGISFNASF